MHAGNTDLGEVAGMLAHELRNPLASAATNLAVAAELTESEDPRSPFLRRAESEMDRIRDLLGACLDLACAGRVRTRLLRVVPVLEAAIGRFDASGIHIDLDAAEELVFAVDPELMARAVENLLENAQRALSGREGRIGVHAELDENGLHLSVEDSGPGLPDLPVFEPFVSGTGGSGLGLVFVRQVVEAHGGEVGATRSGLGGACFEIRLPLSAGDRAGDAWTPSCS